MINFLNTKRYGLAARSLKGFSSSVVLFSFFVVVVLALGSWLLFQSISSPLGESTKAQAYTGENSYDWGEVNIEEGTVSHQFVIENTGEDSLKLANVRTSCSCTTAQVLINDQGSPYFGMHSVSSWVGEVLPGDKAVVEVTFDPAYHGPEGVGPVERFVAVETNDSQNPVLEFKLTANVIN